MNVASAEGYPDWSVKGFGSLGLARTDTDKIGFYREGTQTQEVKKSLEIAMDSRLGLQLDIDISDSWHITTQFVIRDHAGDFLEQNLDWAFLQWHPMTDTVVRFGRLGADSFLLSDYRNVGFAYPWMRPPHEFYAAIPITHFDGVDIKQSLSLDDGYLSVKAYAGRSLISLSEQYFDLNFEGVVVGSSFIYETGSWTNRIGYTFFHPTREGKRLQDLAGILRSPQVNGLIPGIAELAPLLSITNNAFHFVTLGTVFDNGDWLVHTEASYIDTETILNPDTFSAYFSVGRRFLNVTLYSVYGVSQTFQKRKSVSKPVFLSPELVELQKTVDGIINDHGVDQQSLSVGMRWDFYPKIAFKMQWTHYWLGSEGIALWQREFNDKASKSINVMSFGIDFIF